MRLLDDSAPGHSARGPVGFTLLEVMVAMSILAVSLVALSEINAGSIAMHTYAKKLTVATFLAKGKMLDIESQMDSDGLPAEGDNIDPSDGDFDDEGFPQYKWKADVVAPKSENLDASKLIAAMMGGQSQNPDGSSSPSPFGASNPSGAPSLLDAMSGSTPSSGGAMDGPLGMLSGLLGGGALGGGALGGGAGGAAAGGLAGSGMGGMAAGMLAGPAQMMIQQITQMVREVRLTVSWQNGAMPEEFTVVEHTVSMGPTGQLPPNATGNNGTQNPNMPQVTQ